MKKQVIALIVIFTVLFNGISIAQTDCDLSTLSANGSGEVKATPDIASISVGVLTKGKTAAEAVSANSIASQKLLDALHSSGITDKDIQTSSISVYPMYKNSPQGYDDQSTIVGYQANNQLTATIRKVADVGKVIDSISLAGNFSVSGVNFSLDNDDAFQSEALAKAVSNARKKADAVAKAASVTITGIKNINVDSFGASKIFGAAADAGVSSTQVLPGDVTVSASVNIQYLLSK